MATANTTAREVFKTLNKDYLVSRLADLLAAAEQSADKEPREPHAMFSVGRADALRQVMGMLENFNRHNDEVQA